MEEYNINDLLKIFKDHSEEYQKGKKEFREKYGEPAYDDSFDLSGALLAICKEVDALKRLK